MIEQWQELKETITELRDNDGTGTQQEVCKFLVNYMGVLEKQMQGPCDDAISRQAVLNTLDRMDKALDTDRTVESYKELLTECYKVLPPVKQEPKTGHWIEKEYWKPLPYDTEPLDYSNYNEKTHSERVYHYYCSECGRDKGEIKPIDKYCPNCGCRMESEDEG